MKYLRIITAFTGAIWAIEQDKYRQIRDFLIFKAGGGNYNDEEIQRNIGARIEKKQTQANAIAVIPVHGVISQRLSLMDEISGPGSSSTERISKDLNAALSDQSVSAIILDIDSPGGTVYGVDELATEIYKARSKKKIVASVNSLATSAAYWIASAASEVFITPSGEAGSIGVFAEHMDVSKWLDKEGLSPTLVSAGEFKTEFNPYAPLAEDARGYLQSRVNDYYDMFLNSVARNRGVTKTKVKNEFGKGRVYGADKSVEVGMVDGIKTFDQVLKQYGGNVTNSSAKLNNKTPSALKPEDIYEIVGIDAENNYKSGPVAPHKTATSDDSWDGPANEKRLPSPMSIETARNSYAWIEDAAARDDEVNKSDCKFIHHEVSESGAPGAANMTACSTGIGILNGGRGGTTIPDEDRQGVYDHLAKHLRDGDREPPELAEAKSDNSGEVELEIEKIKNEFGI